MLFQQNGGSLCWAMAVALWQQAPANQFAQPALCALGAATGTKPAVAVALQGMLCYLPVAEAVF